MHSGAVNQTVAKLKKLATVMTVKCEKNETEVWFLLLTTHRVLPGTRGSLGASIAERLSTPEWEPVKSLALCRLTVTAPAPGEAIEKKDNIMPGRKDEKESMWMLLLF